MTVDHLTVNGVYPRALFLVWEEHDGFRDGLQGDLRGGDDGGRGGACGESHRFTPQIPSWKNELRYLKISGPNERLASRRQLVIVTYCQRNRRGLPTNPSSSIIKKIQWEKDTPIQPCPYTCSSLLRRERV